MKESIHFCVNGINDCVSSFVERVSSSFQQATVEKMSNLNAQDDMKTEKRVQYETFSLPPQEASEVVVACVYVRLHHTEKRDFICVRGDSECK